MAAAREEMVNTLSRLAITTDGQEAEDVAADAKQQQQQRRHAKAGAPASSSNAAAAGDDLEVHREHCVSLGKFLAGRLVEIGVTHAFAVPGDFNLSLLDELEAKEELNMIWTCNELNAGYAADGFCRRRGVGACVVTYGVGGLSAINACAGCYSEDLPVIFISGGANSNDYGANHIIHHTIGLPDLGQQHRAFKEFTCAAVVVQHLGEAHHQVDFAISEALRRQKPAYIEICCNLAGLTDPSFVDPPIPFALDAGHTNQQSLKAAVAATVKALEGATKPVLLGGPRLRARGRAAGFLALADAFKGGVATTADGKGLFPEDHPQFIGHYWGSISTGCTCESVEASDLVLAVGCAWTDYSTLGYSLLLQPGKVVTVGTDRVTIKGGETYGCIDMEAFLRALAEAVPEKPASLVNYRRMAAPAPAPERLLATAEQPGDQPLTTRALFAQVQRVLTPDTCVLADTGDSWFNTVKLALPAGADYLIQMRYGSIGWSVGATLGYSLAAEAEGKRLVSFIGDGSFQVTAQDVSTMMRFGAAPVIFLVNNSGYAIEILIHDGPYNRIQNWDYTALVKAMRHNGQGKLFTARAATEAQLAAALQQAFSPDKADHLAFIEVCVDTDDVSKELLEFGARVAHANSR
ncbi:pyruvate decarboxylase-like protein [Scenedesmus sp. NREL 46B-D3]|nr:pyruvate decarboxylase-like protein [Scenedesmus sp. NREL 46B-D3]